MWKAAMQGWSDMFGLVPKLRNLVILTIAASIAIDLIGGMLAGSPFKPNFSLGLAQVIAVLTAILQTVVLVPLSVAVHRSIILEEQQFVAGSPDNRQRITRFALLAVVIGFAFSLPMLFSGGAESGVPSVAGVVLTLILFLAGIFVAVRILLIFPAIAVLDRAPSLSEAWSDGKGRFWRFVITGFFAGLPLIVLLLILGALFVGFSPASIIQFQSSALEPFYRALNTALAVLFAIVTVSIASRFYLAYAQRLSLPTSSVPR